ncbi:MAG: mandelate racemase/muconate lactonizing enzyme family protein [candidate division KSB1 bacterium]|nr:mandelate racemase/muconate lactonizing enzyme family protein [candidate division KSB1 bacterium]
MNRRAFLRTAGATAAALWVNPPRGTPRSGSRISLEELEEIARRPVLKKEYFPEPVILEKAELLTNGGEYIVRMRAKGGAEGYAVSNSDHMGRLYPILLHMVLPYFVGRDARELDAMVDGVYQYDSYYKYQGLAFWVCVASAEFAVLDLLGRIAGKPVGELVGQVERREISVYRANNDRGRSAEESVELIRKNVEETGAKAAKYKLGGRMGNPEYPPGRSEKLIYLVRKVLGDEIVLYADANGSYSVAEAIRIGRMLEETRHSFFEEPCPFDHYGWTKKVADTLTIPIAGGEQDSSLWLFQWMIAEDVLQVVQPDLFYFGGFVRCIRVARMAEAAGIPCTPHISGAGLGYLYVLHFASCIPNPGPYQEYKGVNPDLPLECATSDLVARKGVVVVPSGPGWGIDLDPKFLEEARRIEA